MILITKCDASARAAVEMQPRLHDLVRATLHNSTCWTGSRKVGRLPGLSELF